MSETIAYFPGAGKDPDEILDYSFNIVDLMQGSPGDGISTIVPPVWSCLPVGAVTFSNLQTSEDIVSAFVTGGTLGTEVTLTCKITTTEGRVLVRSGILIIADR